MCKNLKNSSGAKGLISVEDLHNDSPEAEDSSEVNEEGALEPTTNNFRLIFLSSPLSLTFCFFYISFKIK
jgi:hypothetical protein